MDFSVILIFPFSAFVAFITLIGAALAGRERPRLIWPLAFSTLVTVPNFLRLPTLMDLGLWVLAFCFTVLLPAAIGTIIGALLARAAIAGIRWIKSL